MSSYKLGVQVVSAHDLMPRDGQGSANACVELHFDGQKFRTTVKEKDLNPVWNESFYFNISDPASVPDLALEAYIYNINKAARSKSFLGRVWLAGTTFVPYSDAGVLHYPLEKRGLFSRVKGELGVKVFLATDDHPSIMDTSPLPTMDPFPNNALNETSPVEQMQYIFVRVVKARYLPANDITGSLDPYVEVKLGNYKGITKHFLEKQNPQWNQVFAFSRDRLQASVVEVVVKNKDLVKDDLVGFVRIDLSDVPTRVPPDSPVAPEWYRLEDKRMGELMLVVWIGTQADEAFPDACVVMNPHPLDLHHVG